MKKLKVSEFKNIYYQSKSKYLMLVIDKKPILTNEIHFLTGREDMFMLVSFLKKIEYPAYEIRAKEFVEICIDESNKTFFGIDKEGKSIEIQFFNVEQSFEILDLSKKNSKNKGV